jgi:hypothetical protein
MPRGGRRPGAGGKPAWRHGKTKTIRVPDVLAEKILQIARILDEEGISELEGIDESATTETASKVIDLSGVSIHAHQRGPAVYLTDLLKAGFEIKPERLVRSLKPKVEGDLRRLGDLESLLEEFYE